MWGRKKDKLTKLIIGITSWLSVDYLIQVLGPKEEVIQA